MGLRAWRLSWVLKVFVLGECRYGAGCCEFDSGLVRLSGCGLGEHTELNVCSYVALKKREHEVKDGLRSLEKQMLGTPSSES